MRTATRSVLRSVVVGVFILTLLVSSLPATAAEDTGGATEEETTTTTTGVIEFEYLPAVTVPPPAPEEAEQPWTTKFLIPTGLALATIAIFVTVVQYFLRVVRSRYKVVE